MRLVGNIRGWSRRRKIVTGSVAGVVLLAGGAALAAFLLRADIEGGGNVVDRPNIFFTAANVDSFTDMVGCTAEVNPATGVATVNLTDAFTGGLCNITFTVQRTGGGGDVKVQNFTFSDTTDDRLQAGECGKLLPVGITNVMVRVVVPAGTASGPFTANAEAGIEAVDSPSFVLANCPSF